MISVYEIKFVFVWKNVETLHFAYFDLHFAQSMSKLVTLRRRPMLVEVCSTSGGKCVTFT